MKAGLAATDRIILVPPRVIVVCQLMQCCGCRVHTLIFESVGVDSWGRLCDQRLVRNVRITLSWRLRECAVGSEVEKSNDQKICRLHGRNRNVTIPIGNATKSSDRLHHAFVDGALCTAKRLQKLLCKFSMFLVEFAQQLLLQMSPRGLFDCATLGRYSLLLHLTLSACSRFQKLRHVTDFGPARTDLSLFWFSVWIHKSSTGEFVLVTHFVCCFRCVIRS
jgi:hypothetical protein